jgi:hypothetical protein
LLKKTKKNISFGRGPQLGDMVFSDTPRVRLDSGGRQFRRRWGYDGSGVVMGSAGGAGPGSLSNGGAGHLEDIEEDGDDFSDTYSLRDETLYNSILHEGKSHSQYFQKFRFLCFQWEDVEEDCRLLSLCLGVTTFSIYIEWRNSYGGILSLQGLQEEAKSSSALYFLFFFFKKKETKMK